MTQKPTSGRIVHYVAPGYDHTPMLVTSVAHWDEMLVAGYVFYDPCNNEAGSNIRPVEKVPYAEAAESKGHTWHWPEREGG